MKIKPNYFVYDNEAKRYVHNTTRDQGIYSSQAVELFTRDDLETAYRQGVFDGLSLKYVADPAAEVDQLIEHDGKPYKEG